MVHRKSVCNIQVLSCSYSFAALIISILNLYKSVEHMVKKKTHKKTHKKPTLVGWARIPCLRWVKPLLSNLSNYQLSTLTLFSVFNFGHFVDFGASSQTLKDNLLYQLYFFAVGWRPLLLLVSNWTVYCSSHWLVFV